MTFDLKYPNMYNHAQRLSEVFATYMCHFYCVVKFKPNYRSSQH